MNCNSTASSSSTPSSSFGSSSEVAAAAAAGVGSGSEYNNHFFLLAAQLSATNLIEANKFAQSQHQQFAHLTNGSNGSLNRLLSNIQQQVGLFAGSTATNAGKLMPSQAFFNHHYQQQQQNQLLSMPNQAAAAAAAVAAVAASYMNKTSSSNNHLFQNILHGNCFLRLNQPSMATVNSSNSSDVVKTKSTHLKFQKGARFYVFFNVKEAI